MFGSFEAWKSQKLVVILSTTTTTTTTTFKLVLLTCSNKLLPAAAAAAAVCLCLLFLQWQATIPANKAGASNFDDRKASEHLQL